MFYPARLWRVLDLVLGLALLAACNSTPPTAPHVSSGTGGTPAHAAPVLTRATAGSTTAATTVSRHPASPTTTVGSTAAATTVSPPTDPAELDFFTRRVVYGIPGMERVRVRHDLTYQTTNASALKMDVYYPVDLPSGARLPAVLFIHGGPVPPGVSAKDSGQFRSWGQLIAASGLIAVTFNWRVGVPSDIDALIKHIRDDATALQLDPDQICLFGVSAGVEPLVTQAMQGTPAYLRCIVAYYGNVTNAWFRLRRQKRLTVRIAPLLIAQGANDEIISPVAAEQFVKDATAKGVHAELLIHPTGVHAFDILRDDEQSRQIIKKTITFLQAQLKPR